MRTGSKDVEHFVRSQTEEGYIAEIREAGFVASVVIGRDTPAISNDNDQIHALVSRHRELVGVGSVDPERLGRRAVDEAERAIRRRIEGNQSRAGVRRTREGVRRSAALADL